MLYDLLLTRGGIPYRETSPKWAIGTAKSFYQHTSMVRPGDRMRCELLDPVGECEESLRLGIGNLIEYNYYAHSLPSADQLTQSNMDSMSCEGNP